MFLKLLNNGEDNLHNIGYVGSHLDQDEQLKSFVLPKLSFPLDEPLNMPVHFTLVCHLLKHFLLTF
jgi:hypothetical protein